ncbi:MAG: flagellin [Verrucomicrobia bacterium]|nr:flagellin [Verrucomicrobiota bacterium]
MVSINTNIAANIAARNIYDTKSDLEGSLSKLSSGSRIVKSSDDAGGMAVSMKMDAQELQLSALEKNLTNSLSLLETQEGALRILSQILSRISELEALKVDVTKNKGDIENYDKEIKNLQSEIVKIREEKFNGVRLFSSTNTADSMEVDGFPLNDNVVEIIRPPLGQFTTETRTFNRIRESSNLNSFDTHCLSDIARNFLFHNDNSLVNNLGSVPSGNSSVTFGENALTRNDDGSSSAIDITSIFGSSGINFNGVNYTQIYVNNNGNITFGSPLSTFTPSTIASGSGIPIIAPFWADVDTREPINPSPSPGGNSTGSNLTYYDLDVENAVLTITWDDVRFYNNTNAGTNPNNVSNSFQLQIMNNCNGNAIIVFRYENIDWTAGQASNSDVYGLGGTPARAGFNNGAVALELPQSGNQDQMLELESSQPNVGYNSGRPGVFIFQLSNGQITPPIDETVIETVTETVTTWHSYVSLEELSDYTAQNGASQSAIRNLVDSVKINRQNLNTASSRIKDVDIASETSKLSSLKVIQEAGVAMLSQANISQQSILRLLQIT